MAHEHDHDAEHDAHDESAHAADARASRAREPAGCGHCAMDESPSSPTPTVSGAHRDGGHDHDHSHRDDHGKADHQHDHTHDFRHVAVNRLRTALILTLGFMFVEVFVGIWGRSLTLASDGGHMFADAGALLLALIAQRFAARRATPERTYGFRRAETLAAFVNGVALTATAIWVVTEAWHRFRAPVAMRGEVVVPVSVLGLMVNILSAWILSRGSGHNANTRAALAHVIFDGIGSVIAITAGVLSWRFHLYRVDPALSVAMAVLILFGAWTILKSTISVLMEGTPSGLDLGELASTIRATPGVADFHDLHAWTISEGFDAITVHVVLDGSRHGTDVVRDVGRRIHQTHRVAHVTVQPEAPKPAETLRPAASLVPHSN